MYFDGNRLWMIDTALSMPFMCQMGSKEKWLQVYQSRNVVLTWVRVCFTNNDKLVYVVKQGEENCYLQTTTNKMN